MNTATIYFSDQSTLIINESDCIIPVSLVVQEKDNSFASMGKPFEICYHIHDGLIPALTTALCQCDFFYVNSNGDTIYSSNSVVRIKNN